MREISAKLGIAALLSAFLQAPFLHIHADHSDHPASSIAHLHLPASSGSGGVAIGAHTPDEDAIEAEWHIAPPPVLDLLADLAVSEAGIVLPLPLFSEAVATPQPRGHDPPDFCPTSPRSPPV